MGISGFRYQHGGKCGDDRQWSGLVQQDWFDVDPHYGSIDESDRLMADCARKDVRVIMRPSQNTSDSTTKSTVLPEMLARTGKSPFSRLKRMFKLRARHKELAMWHLQELRTDHLESVFAALHTSEDRQALGLVCFDLLERPDTVQVFFPDDSIDQVRNYYTGEVVPIISQQFQMRMPLLRYPMRRTLS
jgi:glycosidase